MYKILYFSAHVAHVAHVAVVIVDITAELWCAEMSYYGNFDATRLLQSCCAECPHRFLWLESCCWSLGEVDMFLSLEGGGAVVGRQRTEMHTLLWTLTVIHLTLKNRNERAKSFLLLLWMSWREKPELRLQLPPANQSSHTPPYCIQGDESLESQPIQSCYKLSKDCFLISAVMWKKHQIMTSFINESKRTCGTKITPPLGNTHTLILCVCPV